MSAVIVGSGHCRDNEAMKNLFRNIPADLSEELVETLARGSSTSIKRIVSKGHTSGWYDQQENELVVVLKGAARLEFEEGHFRNMGPGDCMLIPARVRHRVAWTAGDTETVWLAVHFSPEQVAE